MDRGKEEEGENGHSNKGKQLIQIHQYYLCVANFSYLHFQIFFVNVMQLIFIMSKIEFTIFLLLVYLFKSEDTKFLDSSTAQYLYCVPSEDEYSTIIRRIW